MAVPRSRLVDLMKVQCRLFNTIFNPDALRLGNKVLRQRLRGPAAASYYPRRTATFRMVQKLYRGYDTYNDYEEDRTEHVQYMKNKGKGAPKKSKGAQDANAKKKKKK